MQKEELKTLVKKYFNLTDNNTNSTDVKAESFDSAKLVDGTEITNMSDDEFAVGQELHVITEAGEHVIAPSGEHTTDSGIVLVVDGEGKITGYHRPGETGQGSLSEQVMTSEAETVTEEKLAESNKFDISDGDEPIAMREEIVEAIMESVGPEIEALKSKLATMEDKMSSYEERMSAHMSSPAADPIETREKLSATLTKKDTAWSTEPFDQKKVQYDMVLKAVAAQTKLKTNK